MQNDKVKYLEGLDMMLKDIVSKSTSDYGLAFSRARKFHKTVIEWHDSKVIDDETATKIRQQCRIVPDYDCCKPDEFRIIFQGIRQTVQLALVDAILV